MMMFSIGSDLIWLRLFENTVVATSNIFLFLLMTLRYFDKHYLLWFKILKINVAWFCGGG